MEFIIKYIPFIATGLYITGTCILRYLNIRYIKKITEITNYTIISDNNIIKKGKGKIILVDSYPSRTNFWYLSFISLSSMLLFSKDIYAIYLGTAILSIELLDNLLTTYKSYINIYNKQLMENTNDIHNKDITDIGGEKENKHQVIELLNE